MLQCSQGLARISTPRVAARPKGRRLVGPLRAAETRPNVRVPPLWAIFGFSQGFDLVFGGVLDHFLARETALARPDMPLLDRFYRA